MISIQGKGVSTGVAMGPLYYYQRAKSTIRRYEVADVESEWARFTAAQAKAIEQLGELYEKALAEAGEEAAILFETHQMMAEDLDYEEAIQEAIQGGLNAYGWQPTDEEYAKNCPEPKDMVAMMGRRLWESRLQFDLELS